MGENTCQEQDKLALIGRNNPSQPGRSNDLHSTQLDTACTRTQVKAVLVANYSSRITTKRRHHIHLVQSFLPPAHCVSSDTGGTIDYIGSINIPTRWRSLQN